MEKISIIIPIYNAERYLIECLESIVQQSIFNWEVIAVNDFSTDKTAEILEKIAQKDARFKIFTNQFEKGIIGALQTAYLHASGNFITRMDADDIMLPQKLAQLQQILLQKGRGTLAIGQVQYFSAQGVGNGYKRYETWLNELTQLNQNFSQIYKECVVPSPAWMCWKADFDACGGFNSAIYPEDYDLAFRFKKANLQCVGTPEIVHLWRDYAHRTSRTDSNYADNRFIDIKVKYFIDLEWKPTKKLLLWGGGKKGKAIATLLIAQNIDFRWICNNTNKIGQTIYGVLLENEAVLTNKNAQIIIAVAGDEQQNMILDKIKTLNFDAKDCYFFC